MSIALLTNMADKVANNLGMPSSDNGELINTLKKTAFAGAVTNEQMVALLVVANQYGLNPWTREIYAFPHKGSIVPIVGIDGWLKIINSHPQFDGMEFEQDDEKCTCTIYRKDRSRPISVTEYLDECRRSTDPWKNHTKRMLRHKATMQCARYAFGLALSDQDDADAIVERDVTPNNIVDVEVVEGISSTEAMKVRALLKKANKEETGFLNWIGASDIFSLNREQYEKTISILNDHLNNQPAEQSEPNPVEDVEFAEIDGEEVDL